MASSTLKIPVPAEQRGTTSEGVIAAGHDDHDLHFVRYHPPSSSSSASPPALSVVFVHGFVEHIGRYKDAFPLFAARGIELIAYDQRGFGKTADERLGGFQKNYTDTVWPKQFRDVQAVVVDQRQWLDQKYGENTVPIYLVGHSMGGGIVTGIMTRDASSQDAKELEQVRTIAQGVVASSPWLVLTNRTPAPIAFLAPYLLKVFPNMKYPVPLKADDLSRDPAVREAWTKDPYIQKWVFAKSAFGPLQGGEDIVDRAWKNWIPGKPLLTIHGEEDTVTSYKASKQLAEQVKTLPGCESTTEYRGFPGGRHEMLFELGDVKSEFGHAVIDWLLKQAGDRQQQQGGSAASKL